jgi:stringent starvation protein B
MLDAKDTSSTRPYLIRALYEWCTDNGYTPFIAVAVDETVRVPTEFVKDGEIVLNISFDATSALSMGNSVIQFKGRFGGIAREIVVPVGRVLAIYARENGQGMAFPMPVSTGSTVESGQSIESTKSSVLTRVLSTPQEDPPPAPRSPGGAKPSLKRVK